MIIWDLFATLKSKRGKIFYLFIRFSTFHKDTFKIIFLGVFLFSFYGCSKEGNFFAAFSIYNNVFRNSFAAGNIGFRIFFFLVVILLPSQSLFFFKKKDGCKEKNGGFEGFLLRVLQRWWKKIQAEAFFSWFEKMINSNLLVLKKLIGSLKTLGVQMFTLWFWFWKSATRRNVCFSVLKEV